MARCSYCGGYTDLLSGIYDDGDSMCAACIAGYASDSLNSTSKQTLQNQLNVNQKQLNQESQNQKARPKKPKKRSL